MLRSLPLTLHYRSAPFPSHLQFSSYRNLFSLQFVLSNRESSFQQLCFFLSVTSLKTSSHTGAWISTCVHNVLSVMVLSVVQQGFDSRLGEAPCTGIERFFLTPNNGLGIGVHVKVLFQLLPWEGVELFDTSKGSVLDVVVGAVFAQGGINLSCAKDNTLDLLRLVDRFAMFSIRNNPAELRVTSEFFNWRTSNRMTEERFGEENDKS